MPSSRSQSLEEYVATTDGVYVGHTRSCSLPLVGDATLEEDILSLHPTKGSPSSSSASATSLIQHETEDSPIRPASSSASKADRARSYRESTSRREQKRWFSADAATKARRWFTSPDRYVPSRPAHDTPNRPFRSSKHPSSLSPSERYMRRRDRSVDPFRLVNVPPGNVIRRSVAGTPPRYQPHLVNDDAAYVLRRNGDGQLDLNRQISAGGVWNVGGTAAATGGGPAGIPDGRGGLLGSGTNAPMYDSHFLDHETPDRDRSRHENRVALALDIDQATRILASPSSIATGNERPMSRTSNPLTPRHLRSDPVWDYDEPSPQRRPRSENRAVPITPFRVLDAPRLRDDFYCSTLAYSYTSRTLAVGLSTRVYLWSEEAGVQYPPLNTSHPLNWVTSLSFSSTEGERSILAVGRQSGKVTLWSPLEAVPRFEAQQPNPVSCVIFKPLVSRTGTEDLLVSDDLGNVYYYAVEWPMDTSDVLDWNGSMTLLAKIHAHTQQICGLAWSPCGTYFATGGNDNAALLFEANSILGNHQVPQSSQQPDSRASTPSRLSRAHSSFLARLQGGLHGSSRHPRSNAPSPNPSALSQASAPLWQRVSHPETSYLPATAPHPTTSGGEVRRHTYLPGQGPTLIVPRHSQKHTFRHSAAVKALAFASWQPTLLATGGGSNDRCIHFYHCPSGSCLATIAVHAQITSLIWSKTRREICATFGYAQPEHGIRIAVFAWPSGEQVVAIPWGQNEIPRSTSNVDGGRALWAIPYPGGPNETATRGGARAEGEGWWSRTAEEGCIIVASSDESVKFHEVWCGSRKNIGKGGLFGGSDILEGLEGIDKESLGRGWGEVIR